jgi:DNA-binding MurR/RpiR family transcriptional regulator
MGGNLRGGRGARTSASGATVAERVRARARSLTPAERRLVDALMANYPVAGLSNMSEFARAAGVSTPSVLRLAKKLGFEGFPGLQAALRAELEAQLSTPLAKHDHWAESAPARHILNQFAAAVTANLERSLKTIDHREFDTIVALVADGDRGVHLAGGRITRAFAEYLHTHLQVVREGVRLVPSAPGLWPQHVLDMKPGDVFLVFDVRRYEVPLLELARMAHGRGAVIVLFTDQWMSPIAGLARHILPLRIAAPSSWDSGVVTLFMVEALIAAAVNATWESAKARLADLEGLFDASKGFRKAP